MESRERTFLMRATKTCLHRLLNRSTGCTFITFLQQNFSRRAHKKCPSFLERVGWFSTNARWNMAISASLMSQDDENNIVAAWFNIADGFYYTLNDNQRWFLKFNWEFVGKLTTSASLLNAEHQNSIVAWPISLWEFVEIEEMTVGIHKMIKKSSKCRAFLVHAGWFSTNARWNMAISASLMSKHYQNTVPP